MYKKNQRLLFSYILMAVLIASPVFAEPQNDSPAFTLPKDMGDHIARETARVKAQFEVQAKSLFSRRPLGWDLNTLEDIYQWILYLPLKLPKFAAHIVEQGKLLGAVGSLIMIAFLSAVIYSLFGRNRVMKRVEKIIQPLKQRLPDTIFPYVFALLKITVASLIPLLLLGIFSLVNAMIAFREPWFLFIGDLLKLWALGALFIRFFNEILTHGLFFVDPKYGKLMYRVLRIATLYVLVAIGVLKGAESFQMPPDVQGLIRFVIHLSIVCVLFLLVLKKDRIIHLLPDLPYKSYQSFVKGLHRYYLPVIFLTFVTGLFWCMGYRQLSQFLWVKTWAVAAVFVVIMIFYHLLLGVLNRWAAKKEDMDEAARLLVKYLRIVILYTTVAGAFVIILELLGLLGYLKSILSFPVISIGSAGLSLWILFKAILLLLGFWYVSRLIQAYLDYKVYPGLGIETGLSYALNTFFHYLLLIIGVLISLRIVGLDLRVLMVFAGAVGIGIGFGLQSMAANIISGFAIIFGGKLRKGDWIQVGDTIGVVTDIHLRLTRVKTRDDIEYLIPNAEFISSTFINYTLSSPTIRIKIPVGVSYDSDPAKVKEILLQCTNRDPLASFYKKPQVRFTGLGDSSLDFELRVWIDVRKMAIRRMRSRLYFIIFEELNKAGIEIPYPQRDLHLRSGIPWPDFAKPPV